MSNIAIRVENLSKLYKIGARRNRHDTLRDHLAHGFKSLFSRNGRSSSLASQPSTLSGQQSAVSGHPSSVDARSDTIWALKDVSFEVKHGEVVGIIGRNGSGKSTLLKILSRITEPTTGSAEIHGRVGSLLEVGTGFHAELTGRENIYLNGAILGMGKAEINRKFDEIVAFSEIEKFIDTPVKRYSSGMYVRLAFAVAAHLEPEILIVDEVLAVGDAVFQKKCLGKIGDVAKEGRTVLFVSHNMAAMARLCEHGLLLDEGNVVAQSSMDEVVGIYIKNMFESAAEVSFDIDERKEIQLLKVRLLDPMGKPAAQIDRKCSFALLIEYVVRKRLVGVHVGVMLDKADGTPVFHFADIDTAPDNILDRHPGMYRAVVDFPGGLLNTGAYQLRMGIGRYGGKVYDYREPFTFHLIDRETSANVGFGGRARPGILALSLDWKTEKLCE